MQCPHVPDKSCYLGCPGTNCPVICHRLAVQTRWRVPMVLLDPFGPVVDCSDPDELAWLQAQQRPRPTTFPSIGQQVINLARSVVAHVANGGAGASPEVQDARAALCRACPFFDGPADRCSKCGCHLSVKRSWASSSCPDNPPRWTPV